MGCQLITLYVVRQVIGLIGERKRHSKYALAELFNGTRSIKINALFDSGNLLTDENGEAVVVTDPRYIEDLGDLNHFGEMCVHTASGAQSFPPRASRRCRNVSCDGTAPPASIWKRLSWRNFSMSA